MSPTGTQKYASYMPRLVTADFQHIETGRFPSWNHCSFSLHVHIVSSSLREPIGVKSFPDRARSLFLKCGLVDTLNTWNVTTEQPAAWRLSTARSTFLTDQVADDADFSENIWHLTFIIYNHQIIKCIQLDHSWPFYGGIVDLYHALWRLVARFLAESWTYCACSAASFASVHQPKR